MVAALFDIVLYVNKKLYTNEKKTIDVTIIWQSLRNVS